MSVLNKYLLFTKTITLFLNTTPPFTSKYEQCYFPQLAQYYLFFQNAIMAA